MQCPHCAHPDSIRYGTSRSVQHYRCQALPTDLSNTTTRQRSALKQLACQLYLGDGDASDRPSSRHHHKTVSRWLVQAAQALPANPPQTEVCSFIEIDELHVHR